MDVVEGEDQLDEPELPDQPESWSAEAYFTSTNYQAKKVVFLLFINRTSFLPPRFRLLVPNLIPDRLVESPRMKRAFEAAYQGILPKGTSPFMYLRS